MNTERIVIAGYQPFPGKEEKLLKLTISHAETLRKEGLISDREPIIMQAKDGTIVEVFGWKSKEAIEAAHSNPVVVKLWEEYANVCKFIPVAEVKEAKDMFSEFTPKN